MYPIWQYPSLVVESTQTQLLLHISHHFSFSHSETLVCRHVFVPLESRLEPLPPDGILPLVHSFRAKLAFTSFGVHEITLRAERDHLVSFALQFEQPRGAAAPLVPREPLFFSASNWALISGFTMASNLLADIAM